MQGHRFPFVTIHDQDVANVRSVEFVVIMEWRAPLPPNRAQVFQVDKLNLLKMKALSYILP